jgi:hypothetical protein
MQALSPSSTVGRGYSAVIICSYTVLLQAHRPMSTVDVIRVTCIACITVKRKTITIREDQDEWIEDQHLNLSSFVREQLDELIEERE